MPPSDERIEVSPGTRIGNPRPVGRFLPIIPASGHGIVSDVRTRINIDRPAEGEDTEDPPPFYPVSVQESGGSYRVTMQPGVVASWNPREGNDTLLLYTPEVDGVSMAADPRPAITVGIGEWVSVNIKTDPQNQIRETPTIVVADELGTCYTPEAGDTDPEDGEHWVKLFKLEASGSGVVATGGVQSDILLCPYLWTGVNVGGGPGRCLKEYIPSESAYRFRTFGDGFGTEVRQVGDLIETWLKAENVGTGVPIFIDPEDPDNPDPPAEAGDPAQFRTLTGRGSDDTDGSGATQQIEVREDPANPKNVQVVGNKKVASVIFTRNGDPVYELKWDDGLVTNENGMTIELCCEPSSTETPGP